MAEIVHQLAPDGLFAHIRYQHQHIKLQTDDLQHSQETLLDHILQS